MKMKQREYCTSMYPFKITSKYIDARHYDEIQPPDAVPPPGCGWDLKGISTVSFNNEKFCVFAWQRDV